MTSPLLTYRARAPLRLGLAGGGTDVSPYCDLFGGAVLNSTISLYAHTTLQRHGGDCIRFVAQDLGIEEEHPLDRPVPETSRLPLHRSAYNRMTEDFRGGEREPLTLVTHCDAPIGSGLGSSSTLMVSILQAFDEAWELGLSTHSLARRAFTIERVDAGLHGGKQDQYAAAFGGFNFMEFDGTDDVRVSSLKVKEHIRAELEASLILFYTGRSRQSAAIIDEESRNVREKNQAATAAMHCTKKAAFAMKTALENGQISTMGEIMREAWQYKKGMAKGISNSMIDSLYEAALGAGAYCGKVSGAGGGGFMMFLVDPAKRLAVQAALTREGSAETFACSFTGEGAKAWRAR